MPALQMKDAQVTDTVLHPVALNHREQMKQPGPTEMKYANEVNDKGKSQKGRRLKELLTKKK